MIRLFDYWRSSASYRVRIALNLSGEEWESEVVNLLDGSHRSDAHLARNPQGLVPVLDVDGHSLTQSLAQIEYLDETRALGLLPASPLARAKVRALAYAIAMEIHPVCNLNVAKFAVDQSDGAITMDHWMRHFIPKGLAAFEQMIAGGDFCYEDGVTLADLCLMPQLYNAGRWGVDLAPYPKIRRIKASLETIPAFQQAHPDNSAR